MSINGNLIYFSSVHEEPFNLMRLRAIICNQQFHGCRLLFVRRTWVQVVPQFDCQSTVDVELVIGFHVSQCTDLNPPHCQGLLWSNATYSMAALDETGSILRQQGGRCKAGFIIFQRGNRYKGMAQYLSRLVFNSVMVTWYGIWLMGHR